MPKRKFTYKDVKHKYTPEEYIYYELIPRAVKYWMSIKGTYAPWQDIDDICSEVYMYYKRDKYLPKLDLETEEPRFLFSLVAYIVPIYFRKVVYKHTSKVDLFEVDNTVFQHLEDPKPAHTQICDEEFRKALLDDMELEIFELYYVYEYSMSEVAKELGVSKGTVQRRIEKIRRRLEYLFRELDKFEKSGQKLK